MKATTRAAVEQEFPGLITAAEGARRRAWAPHSKFHVGAALLFDDGRDERVVGGCNVESDVYGLTICAERNALFAAVAQGRGEPLAMAVVADTDAPVAPCGACRQVMHECDPERRLRVFLVAGSSDIVHETSPSELLPGAFALDRGEARSSPWR